MDGDRSVYAAPLPSGFREKIVQIVGEPGILEEPTALEPFLVEPRGLYRGHTHLMARPKTTQEVSDIIQLCDQFGVNIVPQGGNTGLCGGAMAFAEDSALLLNLGRMNAIRAIDPINHTITVEAGCILADVQKAAAEVDRLFPLSYGSEGSCVIGGSLSTNAGGTAVVRYGNARDLCLGVEVVLPDGRIWNGLKGLRKDNTGYDLKHLFIGGEGTLGIITAAVLKLFPRPDDVQTAFVALRDLPAAMELFARAREASSDTLNAFELIPRISIEMSVKHVDGIRDPLPDSYETYVLMEMSGAAQAAEEVGSESTIRVAMETLLSSAIEDGLVLDAVLAESLEQGQALWRIREALVEAQKFEGGSIKHDVSVPISRMADFITSANAAVQERLPGIRPVAFGHVGDGNVHYNLSQPAGEDFAGDDRARYLARWHEMNDIVHAIADEMGGSISAEHGVGRLKCDELPRFKDPVELDLMRTVKAALDPKGIMNPGKVVPGL
ncbi:MAG: FAD-binding oxidoreductase [Pseudomonadota bacterium]